MGWRESHFSLKSQQYMTYTPPDQWILIEIEIFKKKFLSVQYTCWLLTRVFRKSIIHIYKIYNMWKLQEFFCCWHKGTLIFKCLFVETLQFVTLCSFSLQDSENWKQLTFRLKKFISSEKLKRPAGQKTCLGTPSDFSYLLFRRMPSLALESFKTSMTYCMKISSLPSPT